MKKRENNCGNCKHKDGFKCSSPMQIENRDCIRWRNTGINNNTTWSYIYWEPIYKEIKIV